VALHRPMVESVAVGQRLTRRFLAAAGPVLALDEVDVDVPHGLLTVIAGPSGSGKSTLLSLLACADRPDTGTVTIGDVDVLALGSRARRRLRRESIGIVLPQPSDNLLDQLDAAGNLAWSTRQRRGRRGRSEAASANEAELLAAVGLNGAGAKRVRQLSTGEQQRLAVACALTGAPQLVVADEPTASLDRANAEGLVEVLRGAASRGATLVVASHDEHVIEAADTVVRLDRGRRIA
jgi:putative ABC transport system ATP-binding protein